MSCRVLPDVTAAPEWFASPVTVDVPEGLARNRALGPDWVSWLDRLPGLATTLLAEWELERDGEPMHGFCSLVLPVRTPGGREVRPQGLLQR